MSKISSIIQREYITRIRKKSFIIITLLGPILFGALMVGPIWLTQLEDTEVKSIGILELDDHDNPIADSLQIFRNVIQDNENLVFKYLNNVPYSDIEKILENTDYYGILVLRQNLVNQKEGSVELFAKKQPSMGIENHITRSVKDFLFNNKLLVLNLNPETIEALKTNISLRTIKLEKGGFKEQKLVDVKRGIGYACGFLIYFFIFFFGAQVMRGVIEEKTNRIIEVIITSVRPFELMMGKILGIALLGLTQFLIWVIVSVAIYQGANSFMQKKHVPKNTTEVAEQRLINEQSQPEITEQTKEIQSIEGLGGALEFAHDIDFVLIISLFLFYFIGGYLLYASLFAAIGSAVDSETDTQQFMLPVTIPLIISIVVMMNTIMNPEGQLAFWFSIIPLTSPIIMMARIPFGVPVQEIILSMSILIITFLLITWMAAKIYRIGILMYGKKISFREIAKWLTYKD